jgi:hypothetical protein
MRIIVRPSDGEDAVAVDRELQKAFKVLHASGILTSGGGIIVADGDSHAVLMLERQTDGPVALDVLTRAGIRATEW